MTGTRWPAWSKLLLPLAPLYAGTVRARSLAYRRAWLTTETLPVPVISVGNLTFGGTGKTPTVKALVRDLVRRGWAPAVLTRGYRRQADAPSTLVLLGPDPGLGAAVAGDEPLELARSLPGVPVVVDQDRLRGGEEAIRRGADILLLDDGFQYLRLGRDLDLVLIDAGDPWGGGHLPPRGRLREPLQALRRASAVLVSKLPAAGQAVLETIRQQVRTVRPDLPVLASSVQARRVLTPEGGKPPAALNGRRVLAFAGIGRPAALAGLLTENGAEVVATRWFPDHHQYRASELTTLERDAGDLGALLVTTAKDAVKLPPSLAVWVVEIEVVPASGDWQELWQLLPAALFPLACHGNPVSGP